MSARTEVQVLERGMAAPSGVRFSATALIVDDPNEATFLEAGAWLQRVEGCRSWWWGDYMVAYCAWKLSQDAPKMNRADPDAARSAQVAYTAMYAEAAGVDAYTLTDWKGVAEFYPVGCRHPTLSFAHHWEARKAATADTPHPLRTAQKWLARALKNNWSKTELRAAIREERMNASGEEEPMPTTRMQELYAFTRWARSQFVRINQMTTDEAASLRAEMEPAQKLLAALDAKLGLAR